MNNITTSNRHLSASEYVAISIFTVSCIIGIPLNVYAFYKFVYRQRALKSLSPSMKLHWSLNISDLIVLCFFTPSEVIQRLTFPQWYAGNVMCKINKFFDSFGFCAVSYIVGCIAVERLLIINVERLNCSSVWLKTKEGRVNFMLGVAWVSAIVISIPQLFLWETVRVEDGKEYCQSYFNIEQHRLKMLHSNNSNQSERMALLSQYRLTYGVLHLAFMHYVPFAAIATSYIFLLWVFCAAIISTPFVLTTLLIQKMQKIQRDDSFVIIQASDLRLIPLDGKNNSGYPFGIVNSPDCSEPYHMRRARTNIVVEFNGNNQACTSSTIDQTIPMRPPLKIRDATRKTKRAAFLILTCHLICWLPYCCVALLDWITNVIGFNLTDFVSFSLLQWFYLPSALIVLTSVSNPLLYNRRAYMMTSNMTSYESKDGNAWICSGQMRQSLCPCVKVKRTTNIEEVPEECRLQRRQSIL